MRKALAVAALAAFTWSLTAPEKPSVLPVLFKPRKSDLVAAERQYPLVLKIPATSTDHLEGIERLMKSRSRSTSGI